MVRPYFFLKPEETCTYDNLFLLICYLQDNLRDHFALFINHFVSEVLVKQFFHQETFPIHDYVVNFMNFLWKRKSALVTYIMDCFCDQFVTSWERLGEAGVSRFIGYRHLLTLPYSSFQQSKNNSAIKVFNDFTSFLLDKYSRSVSKPHCSYHPFFSELTPGTQYFLRYVELFASLFERIKKCGFSNRTLHALLLVYDLANDNDWFIDVANCGDAYPQFVWRLYTLKDDHKWKQFISEVPDKFIFTFALLFIQRSFDHYYTWKTEIVSAQQEMKQKLAEAKDILTFVVRSYKDDKKRFAEVLLLVEYHSFSYYLFRW